MRDEISMDTWWNIREYLMKYPRIRKEFGKPNRENRQAKKNFQAYEKVFSSLWQKIIAPLTKNFHACDNSWKKRQYKNMYKAKQ